MAVITGATSGIGFALAARLLADGWHVVFVARDECRARNCAAILKQRYPAAEVDVILCDLADEHEVCHAISEMLRRFPRIDALFNNAAVSLGDERLSRHGNELHFQTNVIAPYLLMTGLTPAISTARGVIINTSGVVIALVRNLKLERLYRPTKFKKFFGAYAQSKLAITTLTNVMAGIVADKGILCRSVDPGPTQTLLSRGEGMPMLMRPLWHFYQSPETAAGYIMDAAFGQAYGRRTGLYISQGKQVRAPASTYDPLLQQTLLFMLEKVTSIHERFFERI